MRTETYDALVEARDEQAWRVQYEDENGDRDWVLIFGENQKEARSEFERLTDREELAKDSDRAANELVASQVDSIVSITEY
ncbi:MAG: hypothetical protein ABEH81_00795 [Halopenitus sp.]